MFEHKTKIDILENTKDDLENLIADLRLSDENDDTQNGPSSIENELKTRLKKWQEKCSMLQAQIAQNNNELEMNKSEISFLRLTCEKHLSQIGELQQSLSTVTRRLEDANDEIKMLGFKNTMVTTQFTSQSVQISSVATNNNNNNNNTPNKNQQSQNQNSKQTIQTQTMPTEIKNLESIKKDKIAEKNKNEQTDKLKQQVLQLQEMIRKLQNESNYVCTIFM